MKRFLTFLLSLSLAAPLWAQEEEDKIGTANMANLVAKYYKMDLLREEFTEYQKELRATRDAKVTEIKAVYEEAQELQKEAQQKNIAEEERSEKLALATKSQKKAQILERELRGWLQRRQAAMIEKDSMDRAVIRKEVLEIVQKVANEEGYDYIFDRSGGSLAGVSVLVYTKDATDLTGVLLARINENAPEKKEAEEEDQKEVSEEPKSE